MKPILIKAMAQVGALIRIDLGARGDRRLTAVCDLRAAGVLFFLIVAIELLHIHQ